MHVFGQEDCDRCTKKPDCICMKCEGYRSSTDHWEWRGISWMPVLPNEGGLSWAPGSLGAEGEQPKNEPLTLQELVELNGQPVWMGEPFNKWARFEIDSKNIQDITPEMKIRKGFMNVNGESVEIPPVNFYREPIKEMPAGKVPQWISVEERRPEPGKRVLATDGVFVGEAYRTSADTWRRYDGIAMRDCLGSVVTHWMPLPGAPKFADLLRGSPEAPEEGEKA